MVDKGMVDICAYAHAQLCPNYSAQFSELADRRQRYESAIKKQTTKRMTG